MVRAGLGIGAEAAALLLTGASLALAAPEPVPETPSVVVLGPETTAAWVFAAVLGLGATAQAATCPRPGTLGTARVLTVDPAQYPRVGNFGSRGKMDKGQLLALAHPDDDAMESLRSLRTTLHFALLVRRSAVRA